MDRRRRWGVMTLFAAVLVSHGPNAYGDDTVVVDSTGKNAGTLDHALQFGPERTLRPVGEDCHIDVQSHERVCVPRLGWVMGPSKEGIASARSGGGNLNGLDFYTDNHPRISIARGGLVGIGTMKPTRAVEVHNKGDVEVGLASDDVGGRLWSIQSSGIGTSTPDLDATFQVIDRTAGKARIIVDSAGTVTVGVLKITGGADIAEPFQLSDRGIPKGAVLRIDETHPGALALSDRAYDTRVAGIVSGANGLDPGLSLQALGASGENVALTGRAYALADATQSPIVPGDLLTTSDTPGHCMKATDRTRAHGAILGKAMSRLASGKGTILVLVSLQ